MQDQEKAAGAGRAIEETANRLKDAGGQPESTGMDRPGSGEPDDLPPDPVLPGEGEDVPAEVPDRPAVPQRDIPDQAEADDPADPGQMDDTDPEADDVGQMIERDGPLPI